MTVIPIQFLRENPGMPRILTCLHGGGQGHDEKVLTTMFMLCSFVFTQCFTPAGRCPMSISRLHELFALAVMFTAGYACMVVG
ncbi:hypothetical protein RJ527_16115 [Thalassospiraceae bacterium LMO-SO8]|nr:hypothetical protein [Alphaproteobacteria bacterium LMO-S08]WND75549.1 hypothetical protein RJ527_16115 [Thalassospiraceae bacterium LMO-SO8]